MGALNITIPDNPAKWPELNHLNLRRGWQAANEADFTPVHYSQFAVREARSPGDIQATFALRAKVFGTKYGEPVSEVFSSTTGRRLLIEHNDFDSQPTTRHFMIEDTKTDELVGCFRLIANPACLPLETYCQAPTMGHLLRHMRGRKVSHAELSRLAMLKRPGYNDGDPTILTVGTYGAHHIAREYSDHRRVVAVVRKGHDVVMGGRMNLPLTTVDKPFVHAVEKDALESQAICINPRAPFKNMRTQNRPIYAHVADTIDASYRTTAKMTRWSNPLERTHDDHDSHFGAFGPN